MTTIPIAKNPLTVIYIDITGNISATALVSRHDDKSYGGPAEFLGGNMVETSGNGTFDLVLADAEAKVLFTATTITATAVIPEIVLNRGWRLPITAVVTNSSSDPFFTVSLIFRK